MKAKYNTLLNITIEFDDVTRNDIDSLKTDKEYNECLSYILKSLESELSLINGKINTNVIDVALDLK